MSLLCPQNYIPSNISTSMDELQISLKGAPAQLQKIYRQRNSGDTILKFAGKQNLAHRYVIQKTSTLFSKGFATKHGDKWYFEINAKGKPQLFIKILSCIYGHSITIRRYEIHQAYQISKSLHINDLLHQLQNDMLTHFDQFDIFPLLKLATKEQLFDVMDLCYDQLQIEMYEPMRYNKSGLFLCDYELFKTIVKRHNFKKMSNQKFGLSYGQINQLIEEYSFVNGLNQQQKHKLIQQIQDKQNLRYYISLNQVLRKPSTPRKTKSASQIFFRNTLTLPRQKDLDKNNSYMVIKNRRLSPCVNAFDKNNDSFDNHESLNNDIALLSPPYICKSQTSNNSKSISNKSTDNKSLQNRSRKQSVGSVQTISDHKVLVTIVQIAQNQKALQQSQTQMKVRAEQMLKKLHNEIHSNKQKSTKIHKMQSCLEEINAQIKCGKQKIKQLQKTVDNVQMLIHKKQAQQQFDRLFETKVDLELTVSTEFQMKQKTKPCKN